MVLSVASVTLFFFSNIRFNKVIFYFKNQFLFLKISNFLYNSFLISIYNIFNKMKLVSIKIYKYSIGDGVIFIRGFFFVVFFDACLTDDEPLWEPVEWSLIQSWILFIFIFAWIAENLITSRYGSYTGRDKRVWYAWYKTYWFIEFWYLITYIIVAMFVIVPFYYEISYHLAFIISWWNWYTRVFCFKFLSIFSLILLLSHFLLINLKWYNWKKLFLIVSVIVFFIGYLLYFQFIISFFGYFTDPSWYHKTRLNDYIQISHESLKWGWGVNKRDHFSYHKTPTIFWFKNDNPFAGSFLMINLFFFLNLFFLFVYWLVLLRRIYATKEITFTLTTYCISSLRQFFYFFLFFYFLIFTSFFANYWRFPIEFSWFLNANSWFFNFLIICKDYFFFLLNIL